MATSMLGRYEASSSSAPLQKWTYDVFISYRGEDTGKNFTDHLYSRLNGAGINTFRDKNELKRGEKISSELFEAIHGSNIFLVVFSQNYASSRWCLDELVEIMKCRKQFSQLVLPIFYKVNPSDVRKQTGSFGEAFVKHDHDQRVNRDKVSSWRKALAEAGELSETASGELSETAALAEAGELSGWDLDATDRYEADFINKIVENISSKLNHTYLHLAIHPVGIDSRIKYMNSLLSVGTNDVRMVGICGMGGIGKTTLAKAVFNHFFHTFEYKSFLANVREKSKKDKNKFGLQKQLIYDLLKIEVKELGSVDGGIEVIKRRLCTKRVLLVLDDVDQRDQLIAFSCHSNTARKDCFAPGSKIIITTRHKHLLELIEVSDNYMIEKLNENDSLHLFRLHAFGTTDPVEDCTQLSRDVVGYCNGLPLALEVLGSCLREVEDITQWKKELEKLKKNPPSKIQDTLKISFDALDGDQKNIFLDIACFFIGMDKDYVTKILDGCGFSPTTGIGILNRRCLLTIDENKLMMHDVLRDMGRKIVCQEPLVYPEQRSRVWHWQDAHDVLRKCKGTDQIECLALNIENMEGPIKVGLKAKAFAAMHNLRLLQLNYVNITGGYEHLSRKLRWLCWHGFPRNSIPVNFYQMELVAIDMQYSKLGQVWKDNKVLEKLKFLDLSHSHLLTRITTNFLTLPNLEELILVDCISLETIDESIGSLDKLLLLNLRDCLNLSNLPRSICKLKSLETLVLTGCLNLDNLPEEIGDIESLVAFFASRTAITQVPVSIVRLKNLHYLSLCGCKGTPFNSLLSLFSTWGSPKKISDSASLLPSSLMGLTSLTRLDLQDCNLLDGAIPEDIGSLSSLQYLALTKNNFSSLPASITKLSNLETFLLEQCTDLKSLPALPSSVTFFSAPNTSLERLPDLSNLSHAPMILLSNCNKLAEFPFTENLLQRWYGRYGGNDCDEIVFPWSEIPDWFNHGTGNVLSFQVPPDMSTMKGVVLCIIFAAHDFRIRSKRSSEFIVYVTNVTKNFFHTCLRTPVYPPAATPHDHLSLGYVPLQEFEVDCGDKVEIEIDTGCELIVKKCGVIPVFIEAKKLSKMDTEEVLNEFNSSSGNDSCMVVHEEGRGYFGNNGKGKCEDEDGDGAGPSNTVGKDKRNWYDETTGGPCHYWSYEEHTLSIYEMEVVPIRMYNRRFRFLDDLYWMVLMMEILMIDDFTSDEDNDDDDLIAVNDPSDGENN